MSGVEERKNVHFQHGERLESNVTHPSQSDPKGQVLKRAKKRERILKDLKRRDFLTGQISQSDQQFCEKILDIVCLFHVKHVAHGENLGSFYVPDPLTSVSKADTSSPTQRQFDDRGEDRFWELQLKCQISILDAFRVLPSGSSDVNGLAVALVEGMKDFLPFRKNRPLYVPALARPHLLDDAIAGLIAKVQELMEQPGVLAAPLSLSEGTFQCMRRRSAHAQPLSCILVVTGGPKHGEWTRCPSVPSAQICISHPANTLDSLRRPIPQPALSPQPHSVPAPAPLPASGPMIIKTPCTDDPHRDGPRVPAAGLAIMPASTLAAFLPLRSLSEASLEHSPLVTSPLRAFLNGGRPSGTNTPTSGSRGRPQQRDHFKQPCHGSTAQFAAMQ